MRAARVAVIVGQGALVLGLIVALATGRMPRGVAGEWEWSGPRTAATALDLALALAAVGLYAAFIALGMIALAGAPRRRREIAWLLGLLVAGAGVQAGVQSGAPA